ncbi:hypothetical protein D3C80_1130340 [compost metagenome]
MGAPGIAGAEAVDTPGAQVGDHLCGRHHHAVDVGERMDAVAGQPVVQPQGMGAGGEGVGEGEFRTAVVRMLAQCLGRGHAGLAQRRAQVDRLTVLVQAHEDGHGRGRAADAQVGAVDLAIEHLRGIQFAADQLVAQAGPGGLAAQVEGQAVGLGEALGGGNDQRRRVGQGHEAEVEDVLFRGIRAGDPGQGVVAGGGGMVGHDRFQRRAGQVGCMPAIKQAVCQCGG